MQLVAEDSVLVNADNLRAYGVGNYLHLRVGARHFLAPPPHWLQDAPIITRRSGVRKFEIEVRRTDYRIAPTPPRISTVVFLSSSPARSARSLLTRISASEARKRLTFTQPYAAAQPGWSEFLRRIKNAYMLRRPSHPDEQAQAIESLLHDDRTIAR